MTSINHVMVWISLIENTQQEENAEGKQTYPPYHIYEVEKEQEWSLNIPLKIVDMLDCDTDNTM